MLQESMIAFQQPHQKTIILQAIDALQQLLLSKDKPKEPAINQPVQPKGPQPIVDKPSLVADIIRRTRLPCNANAMQMTQLEAVCFSLFPWDYASQAAQMHSIVPNLPPGRAHGRQDT